MLMKGHKILPFYRRLCARLGINAQSSGTIGASVETLVPHPLLRRTLQNDPAMAAILEAGGIHLALGSFESTPFRFLEPGLVQLSSALIFDPGALSAAARWGLEAHRMRQQPGMAAHQLIALARYGHALIRQLEQASRECLLAAIPPSLHAELGGELSGNRANSEMLGWLAELTRSTTVPELPEACCDIAEIEYPIEQVLVRGGDSRLRIDPETGCNRYGVPPRPRPEAIHFSSSTASAVTDYGFLVCELLRRDLLSAIDAGTISEQDLKSRMIRAIGQEILDLFGLDETVSDLAVAPSGTDAELLAVLVARAGSRGKPLVNVLIAPGESGSGVPLAAGGCYFDDVAATGVQVARGTAVWPDARIEVREIPIRDQQGRPLAAAQVNTDFLEVCRTALEAGSHLLVHLLMSSKTDLYAPDFDAVADLVAEAPDRVDVVVDACQLRADFKALGDVVRRGWMVQVSGSKFLTGPPFSGALVLPASLRPRAPAIVDGLLQSPGIGSPVDWLAEWNSELPDSAKTTSYGPLFRWLPALLEAKLFFDVPEEFRRDIAARFREALTERMTRSKYLGPLKIVEPSTADTDKSITHSILSFVVLGRRQDMELTPLTEAECKRLFELLNRDVSCFLQPLAPGEEALARQPVHIGQPVTLGSSDTAITVLRLVLGARFFTIVGHSDPESRAAALESEIADAERAIAKVELLASHWWRLG
jgi:hypothetical protein